MERAGGALVEPEDRIGWKQWLADLIPCLYVGSTALTWAMESDRLLGHRVAFRIMF